MTDRKQPGLLDLGKVVISGSMRCRFGFVSSDTLLEIDATNITFDDAEVTPSDSNTPECLRCRRRHVCCGCGRQFIVTGRRATTSGGCSYVAGPEISFDAWSCRHCLWRDLGEHTATEHCSSVVVSATGNRKDDSKADSGLVRNPSITSEAIGNSPRPVIREGTSLAFHVNRAPAGNWWGNRGQPTSVPTNTDAESFKFYHSREDDGDDAGTEVESGSSMYTALYRDRYTVLNVGRIQLGDKTLSDLDPTDDPYMRKFRTCGDLFARLQQLMSTEESLNYTIHPQVPQNQLAPNVWHPGGRSNLRQAASTSAAHATFGTESITTTPITRSNQPSRSCSASKTVCNNPQQQRVVEESRRLSLSSAQPDEIRAVIPGTSYSHLKTRTPYSQISSTSGAGTGDRGGPSAASGVAKLQVSTYDRSATSVEVMKGTLSNLRVSSGYGLAGSQHQQRVAGLCVISGDMLGIPPFTITALDTEVERSPRRSIALLRPQLLNSRKQQQQTYRQQRSASKGSELQGSMTKAGLTGFIEPSELSSLLPFRAAIDATADRSMSNGSGNSTRSSPSTNIQYHLNLSADCNDDSGVAVTEASTSFSRTRHESLSASNQFQTFASRLQLAAAKSSPEVSLLVRLA